MLSEHDRRTLHELERRLAADDAAFVQRFEIAAPPGPVTRNPSSVGLAQILGTLTLGILMLLAGSMAGATAFLGAAALIALAWWSTQDPGRGVDGAADVVHPPDGTQK